MREGGGREKGNDIKGFEKLDFLPIGRGVLWFTHKT